MDEVARTSRLPSRWRWLAVVFSGMSLLCAVLAAVEFRGLRHVVTVDVPLSQAELTSQPDSICGQFRTGLPKFCLRWDGEPPRAWLADQKTGEPLAPPLIQEQTLSLNPRGVLWKGEGDCRFAIDRATYETLGTDLVLRVEKFGSRSPFYTWGFAMLGCGLLAFICVQQARIYSTRLPFQSLARWNEARSMGFVLISLASILVFFPGHPVPHMSGDPANIHSFAAALAAPEDFIHDATLSETRNFKWYTPLYVQFVKCFGPHGMGFHYSTSRAFLVFISSLAGLFGYFSLFRLISRSSAYALAATIGLYFLKAHYPSNENWGPMLMLPRTVYGAFLPWVVVFALRCMSKPHLWWLPAAATGVLFYVHPVSSPALTGALLMSFVFGGPGKWWQRLAWGTLGGVVAVAVMFPYVAIYTAKYSGTIVQDPEMVRLSFDIARERFAPGYLEPLVFYKHMAIYLGTNPRYWFGFAALVLLCRYRWKALTTRVALGITVGYAIVTCVIPTLDVTVANYMGRLPYQIDLIRNVRYLDVWLLGMVAAALREINRPDWGRKWAVQFRIAMTNLVSPRDLSWRLAPALAIVGVFVCYLPSFCRSSYRLVEFSYDNLTIVLGKPYGEMADEIEAYRAVRTMRRPDEVVGGTFHLRQQHIPTSFHTKDLGILAYSSPATLVAAKNVLMESEARMVWPLDQNAAIDQAGILGAQILLMPRAEFDPALTRSNRVLFQNATQVLLRVDPKQVLARRSANGSKVLQVSGTQKKRQ